MKKYYTITLFLLIALFHSPFALADEHKKESCMFMSYLKNIYGYHEQIGLSDEQMQKIKDVKIAYKKGMIQFDAAVDTIKVDLKAGMWEDEIDLKAINKLLDEKYETKLAKAKAKVKALADVKGILTAEQKAQLKTVQIEQYTMKNRGGCKKCMLKK